MHHHVQKDLVREKFSLQILQLILEQIMAHSTFGFLDLLIFFGMVKSYDLLVDNIFMNLLGLTIWVVNQVWKLIITYLLLDFFIFLRDYWNLWIVIAEFNVIIRLRQSLFINFL